MDVSKRRNGGGEPATLQTTDHSPRERPAADSGQLDPNGLPNGQTSKEGQVCCHGASCVFRLTSDGLQLSYTSKPRGGCRNKNKIGDLELSWKHVIGADTSTRGKRPEQTNHFALHYMTISKGLLRAECVAIDTGNEPAHVWVDMITHYCSQVSGRPKNLLAIVNSIGGLGKGVEIYEKKVAPVFQLAHITAKVIYTERHHHTQDVLENDDLSPFDCVVVSGGDGSYQEALQGLGLRMQKSTGVDYNDANSKFVGIDIPVGIIPTGSGNCFFGTINRGVIDVETAILRILAGEIHKSQAFLMHSGGKFVSASGLSLNFGDMNRMSKRNEELRWMKKYRYFYTGAAYILQKKQRLSKPWTLEYQVAPSQASQQSDGSSDGGNEDSNTDLKWTRHDSKGRPYANVVCATSNAIDKEDGTLLNPFSDRLTLYVDMGCPTMKLFKILYDAVYGKTSTERDDNADVLENVQRIRFKCLGHEAEARGQRSNDTSQAGGGLRLFEYIVDVDGECVYLDVPEVEVTVVPSFIPLYSSKIV